MRPLLCTLISLAPLVAAEVIPDDGQDDLPALRASVAAVGEGGAVDISLPAGRIDLMPQRGAVPLTISKRSTVTIRGARAADGTPATTVLIHWAGAWEPDVPTPGFANINQCGVTTIADLRFDHTPLTVGAGTIIAGERGLTVRRLPGHPAIDGMAAFLLGTAAADSGQILRGRHTYDTTARWALQADGTLRVNAGRGQAGDIAYWFPANGGRPMLNTRDLAALTLDNLHFDSASGFTCMLQRTRGDLTVRGVVIAPPAGRYAVTGRDGVHIADVGGAVRITGCHFAGMQDDAINVHGSYELVRVRRDAQTLHVHGNRSLRYRYGKPGFKGRRPNIAVGEALAFLDRAALPAFRTTVTAVEEQEDLSAVITVADALPAWVDADTWIEPLSWLPKTTRISDCTFRDLVGRGIKLSAHDAVIEDCRFLRTTAANSIGALLVATPIEAGR